MNRIDFADGLKAISMLYIVGFWHMIDYTANPASYHGNGLRTFTLVLLSVFVLLSGYFSAMQLKQGRGWRDFFAAKIRGVYFPFLVALAAYVAAGLFGIKWAAGSALLYGMFNQQPPMTLWFICMLMLYFFVSPILMGMVRRFRSNWHRWLLMGVALCSAYIFVRAPQIIDTRVIFYFPAYFFGFLLGLDGADCRVGRYWVFAAVAAVGLGLPFAWATNAGASVAAVELVPSLGGAVLLLAIFPWCWRLLPGYLQRSLLWFSGLSYFVYLFHRPIIEVWQRILLKINADAFVHIDYLGVAALNIPVVLLVSQGVMTAYVRFIDPLVGKLTQNLRRPKPATADLEV